MDELTPNTATFLKADIFVVGCSFLSACEIHVGAYGCQETGSFLLLILAAC